MMKQFWFPIVLALLTLLVGVLYVVPFLEIRRRVHAVGQPFVLTIEGHRNDLQYIARAREIYDGHVPPTDLSQDSEAPAPINLLPSVLFAAFIYLAGGSINVAFVAAAFSFSMVNFLLFYYLGRKLFPSRAWAVLFALVGILTPIALRIMNFDGTA